MNNKTCPHLNFSEIPAYLGPRIFPKITTYLTFHKTIAPCIIKQLWVKIFLDLKNETGICRYSLSGVKMLDSNHNAGPLEGLKIRGKG